MRIRRQLERAAPSCAARLVRWRYYLSTTPYLLEQISLRRFLSLARSRTADCEIANDGIEDETTIIYCIVCRVVHINF